MTLARRNNERLLHNYVCNMFIICTKTRHVLRYTEVKAMLAARLVARYTRANMYARV